MTQTVEREPERPPLPPYSRELYDASPLTAPQMAAAPVEGLG